MLDRFRLDDKVAVVTGASSGLGVAFARGLAEAGADVILAARRVERLATTKKLVEDTGRRAITVEADVTDTDHCQRIAATAAEEFGRVDILVNNAGLGTAIPATRESADEFKSVIDVNLLGAYWMAQACVRVMPAGSSIINISSVLAFTTTKLPQAAYAASKAALIAVTRDLAQQWSGRKGIRVNALAPGFFHTEMTSDYEPGLIDSIMQDRTALGRVGELEECAAALVFLASDAASYITGTHLVVDGGLLTT